jgi:peptidoglycan-associated lipoprotein
MKRASVLFLSIVLMFCVAALYGCPKKAEVSSAPEEQPKMEKTPEVSAAEAAKAEEARKAAEAAAAAKAAEEEKAREAAMKEEAGLKPIYFDFDKSFIRDDSRATMKANADYLKANPNVKLRIEGNCDERGTIEYNQALGQRRAQSAKKYLVDMGVKASRISLISYGKEKPVCTESTEECWQKNRRDDFVAAQ